METEIIQNTRPVDDSLKSKITKAPTTKKAAKQNNENLEVCRIEQLEHLLSVTKSKLSESEERVLTLEEKLDTANLKIANMENASKPSIDNSTIEKLLEISTAVFSNFATKEILDSIPLQNCKGSKEVN